jgi:hypothetical protein
MENKNIKYNRIYVAVIAIFLILSLISNIYYYLRGKEVFASNNSESNTSIVYANENTAIKQVNIEEIKIEEDTISKEEAEFNSKVAKIRKYLANRNSPLADYAEEFVKAADHYGIDYRLVAAISIVESGGGIKNFKPYNAWGWGTRGFSSFKEGIWAVSEGLGKYYAGGRTTPQTIAPTYCPPNATDWANKVSYVMKVISNQ